MAAWDDVNLDAMTFDENFDAFTHPCPCGDVFIMPVDDLINAEELAPCPSCSLLLRVVYDPEEFLRSLEIDDDNVPEKDRKTTTCAKQEQALVESVGQDAQPQTDAPSADQT
jgi:diphthamide biosynthesis protein 3